MVWETVTWDSISGIRIDLSYKDHKPTQFKRLPWIWCRGCGLIKLRNEPTEKAWRLGCNWDDIEKVRGGRR